MLLPDGTSPSRTAGPAVPTALGLPRAACGSATRADLADVVVVLGRDFAAAGR